MLTQVVTLIYDVNYAMTKKMNSLKTTEKWSQNSQKLAG